MFVIDFTGRLVLPLVKGLRPYANAQVRTRGTSIEYVRELIRKDQDRQRLRSRLLAGAASRQPISAGADYFDELRGRVRVAGEQ